MFYKRKTNFSFSAVLQLANSRVLGKNMTANILGKQDGSKGFDQILCLSVSEYKSLLLNE